MRWLALLLLFFCSPKGVSTGEIPEWYKIGAPTSNCKVRYEVEDNRCDPVVLRKERIIKKGQK
jgi:hypothetical protein